MRQEPHRSRLLGLALLALLPLLRAAAGADIAGPAAQAEEAERRGDFGRAVQLWSTLAEDPAPATADLLLRLAAALRELGEPSQAQARLDRTAELMGDVPPPALAVRLHRELGAVLALRGDPEAARVALERSLAIAGENGLRADAALARLRLAELSAAEGQTGQASAGYAEAARLARDAEDPLTASEALAGGARLHAATDPSLAAAWLERAEAAVPAGPPAHRRCLLLVTLGLGHQALAVDPSRSSHLLAAHRLYARAAREADALGDHRAAAYARGYTAQLYEREGRLEEALSLSHSARFAAQQVDAREILFRWEWQSGRLLRRLGRQEEAIAAYQGAVDDLQAVRHRLPPTRPGEESFRDTLGRLYFELADLLLRRAGAAGSEAEAEAYLLAARDTLERFKTAELEDYFRDDCLEAYEAETLSLDDLDPTVAVIYPVVLEDRLELLVQVGGGIHRAIVPVTGAVLNAEVERFRRLLEKRTTRQFLPAARQLYGWLIAPLEPLLDQARATALVVVPDGALRTIPMAALHDGRSFLLERYAVAVTPGMELTGRRSLRPGGLNILVGGLTGAVQGFPALPYVASELEGITGELGGTRLENERFLLQSVARELRETSYSVVHVASHGQFRRDVRDTFLLTFDDRLTLDRLERFIRTGRYRDQPVELLTLSACQTAAGDDRAALGLAGVAVKAGVRSALATLWLVNDQAASELVVTFYRLLNDGGSTKAEALRRAQLALMQDPRYRHPGYWAPFILIGNWL